MPNIDIDSPIGGISRIVGYQTQPPYSVFDAVNLWPTDVRSGRIVLATRPSILPQTSPGANINMIARINGSVIAKPIQSMIVAREGRVYWWDEDVWIAATGTQAGSIETGIPVFGTAFLQQVFIGNTNAEPFVFDYNAGTVELLVATEGTAPQGCTMFAVFEGALCLAGDPSSRNVLFMSRTGDATDYNYGAPEDDEGGAFVTAGENEGLVNGPITALFAHGKDMLIVSTLEGLVVLRGHPRRGGILEPLASEVFVLGQGAWTKGPDDTAYIMTSQGLMSLPPVAGAIPAPVSKEKIPAELIGLDYDLENPSVSLEFDTRWNGIHITVRETELNDAEAWWYDLGTGGFTRQEVAFTPFHLLEFPPFITRNKSGVLYAGEGYGGLGRMDRFSDDEEINSRVISGAIKMTSDQKQKAVLQKLSVVFNGDTIAGDGVLSIAAGGDAEDAIGRLRSLTPQFQVTFEDLIANRGICYPRVTGHCMAFRIDQVMGRYGLEQMAMDVVPMGTNRMNYAPRITTSEDSDTEIVFSPLTWAGYVQGAIPAAVGTLTDYTHFMDLSRITDQTWWANVRPSGADLRVTDQTNGEFPFDLIRFDRDAQTGFLAFKMSISTSAKNVRLWVGNRFATSPVGSAGRTHTYDNNWIGFWPRGAGNDRTINGNNLQSINDLVPGDAEGPIGAEATTYISADQTYAQGSLGDTYPQPITLVGWAENASAVGSVAIAAFGVLGLSWIENIGPSIILNATYLAERADNSGPTTWRAQAQAFDNAGAGATVFTSLAVADTTNGNLYAGTFTSDTARAAFINGANKATNSTLADIDQDMQIIQAGCRPRIPPGNDFYNGKLSLLSAHSAVRPDEWFSRMQSMLTQSGYYGTISVWVDGP